MATSSSRYTVPGSERHAMADAHAIGPAAPDERFEVTVRVRAKTTRQSLAAGGALADELPAKRRYVSRAEYAQTHAADPADLARVATFAGDHQLAVVEASAARRSVVLSGTVQAFNQAFGVDLQQMEHPNGTYRGRTGSISVPGELAGIVQGVFGLDDRPLADPHFQARRSFVGRRAAQTSNVSYTPVELAKLYDFPAGLDGSGQCIGIVELGGGYRPADLKAYFKNLGLTQPKVKTVRVDGGRNHPTNANSADGEVMLDIEVAAAVAPKAHVVVYFAPNTTQGFLDAITTAIHDDKNRPSVISISWGSAESTWTQQSLQQYDEAFQAAAALGVTICVAAGDSGSSDGVGDGEPHVDFPASSPYVLACGGTKLAVANGKISSEVVWNEGTMSATGGGISSAFARPSYQSGVHVSPPPGSGTFAGRGVPDVAGDADPETGYEVRVDGQQFVIGGTSAVAPLWAGLVALINQKLGAHPVGYLNPLLYGSLAGKVTRDVKQGNNGAYAAAAGWDACTGWGSPDGGKLLAALTAG
jgi:kumamolisin